MLKLRDEEGCVAIDSLCIILLDRGAIETFAELFLLLRASRRPGIITRIYPGDSSRNKGGEDDVIEYRHRAGGELNFSYESDGVPRRTGVGLGFLANIREGRKLFLSKKYVITNCLFFTGVIPGMAAKGQGFGLTSNLGYARGAITVA